MTFYNIELEEDDLRDILALLDGTPLSQLDAAAMAALARQIRVAMADCELNANEAAEQRQMADYYGADTPQTVEEHYQAAARDKRRT